LGKEDAALNPFQKQVGFPLIAAMTIAAAASWLLKNYS
jgi:hypothetical protein